MAGERCSDCGRLGIDEALDGCFRAASRDCLRSQLDQARARLALAEAVIEAAKEMRADIEGKFSKRARGFDSALQAFDRAARAETERGTPVANAQETAAVAGKPAER